jgi:D-2-hydroxyacid dehydrogenase (NADP+)
MEKKIVLLGFHNPQIEELKIAHPDAIFIPATAEDIKEKIKDAHALVGLNRADLDVSFSNELIDSAPRLEWVHAAGADVKRYIISSLVNSKITFTNGKILQGPHVADHAMALLLTLTRNIHHVLRNDTLHTTPRPIELKEKKITIIGCGGVGMLITERCASYGAQVSVVNDAMLPYITAIKKVYMSDELHDAIKDADIIICSAPHTSKTRKSLSNTEFTLMKQGSFFINVSRGQLVDTEALTAHADKFAGIGLDVTNPEPLPLNHPLRQKRNVIITPHLAGLSDHNHRRRFKHTCENISRFINNRPLTNIVDKIKEY